MSKCLQSFEEFDKYKKEIGEYIFNTEVSRKDLEHIVHCCKSMTAEVFGIKPCGDFIRAILKNDLQGAVFKADDINRHYLKQYLWFKMNWLPAELVAKKMEKK